MTIIEKIKHLKSGEAIHIGHSYLIINIAGTTIALDPSTETGFCTAPFCNLLPQSTSIVESLLPLINPESIIPSAEKIANHLDIVLYSHLHADHFVASILKKIVGKNPHIKIIWPHGSAAYLSYHPLKTNTTFANLMCKVNTRKLPFGYINGLLEYLATNQTFDVHSLDYLELQDNSEYILQEYPLIKIRAFKVSHPRPQVYIRLPFEPANIPPVLGYEITYNENGEQRKVLLIGEAGIDSKLLWNIWKSRHELTGVFIAVADESSATGLKFIKDIYIHASLRIIPLTERLSGDKTTIHCLHQGLWYYILDSERLKFSRKLIRNCHNVTTGAEIDIEFNNGEEGKKNFLSKMQHLLKLIKAIGCYNMASKSKVQLNSPGEVFSYGDHY